MTPHTLARTSSSARRLLRGDEINVLDKTGSYVV